MPYAFFPHLLLRTPLLSYQDYAISNLPEIISDPLFQKALYLANPVFFEILNAKRFDVERFSERELQTVFKYYNRVCFRCTPLGLFATFSVANWHDESTIALKKDIALHARLDHKVEVNLARTVFSRQLQSEHYEVNPCLYQAYKEYRFVKTTAAATGDKLVFAIESIEKNIFTTQLLKFCSKRRTGTEIKHFIIAKTGCDDEEALDYLQFLVEAQVLRSHADTNIIGTDYLQRLLSVSEINNQLNALETAALKLQDTDISLNSLNSITETISRLSLDASANANFFYSVSERTVEKGGVDNALKNQLIEALQAMQNLTEYQPNPSLQEFIKQFKARYDQQKVPLLHAVDPEIGIGYSTATRYMHNLVPEGNWKKADSDGKLQLQWGQVHRMFMELWHGRGRNSNTVITITEADLDKLKHNDVNVLPPTTAMMFRQSGSLIQIESAGGISALGLIGRFSFFNSEVEAMCREIAKAEQDANPEIIFAELAQLSNLHVDNINRRKHAYNYELPINAVSALPAHKQLALDDLWLSVVDDELILESKSHGKRVMPRHSSAYNILNNDLGVFRLLCDIQLQGIKHAFTFSLESVFPGLQYYPRVQYKSAVLSLAVWNLGDDFINALKHVKDSAEELQLFDDLQTQWNFPAHIALNRGDQFLVFNLDKPDEVQFLLSCIKGLKQLRLQEYLPDTESRVFSDGKPLVGQYIALLYQDQPVYKPVLPDKQFTLYNVKRTHLPGSEWLYLKLYCDQAFADQLLVKKLFPLIRQLQKKGTIKQWFFIRYTDTGYHIRLRMKLHNGTDSGRILALFKDKLFDTVHYRLIKEYVADSYQPELERYGHDIIEDVEQFFQYSSELIAAYLCNQQSEQSVFDLYGFALTSVDAMVNQFISDKNEKLTFYEIMAAAFYREFADDKQLRIEMDNTFRSNRKDIVQAFAHHSLAKAPLKAAFKMFTKSISHLNNLLLVATEARRKQLLSDLIHMHVNRTFTMKQRQQELLVYYFLSKYTQSANAIQKMK